MTTRQIVFRIYVNIFIAIFLGAILFVSTVGFRKGAMPVIHTVVAKGVPRAASEVRRDPWYIMAFVLVGTFLWSVPWGGIGASLASDESSDSPSNVLRGRRVNGPRDANRAAYRELVRRARNAKRQKYAGTNGRAHSTMHRGRSKFTGRF